MEWHQSQAPQKKKFKSIHHQAWMITVFRNCARVTPEDVILRGETDNSDAIRTVTELRNHFKQVWPHKNLTEILLQHDNASPHSSLKTWETITKFDWTMLPYPPDSPNLAPSDFQTLGALKDAICGTMFESEGDVIHALSTWLYK
jgi:histone-lysine N-methyltransferase SETMAR